MLNEKNEIKTDKNNCLFEQVAKDADGYMYCIVCTNSDAYAGYVTDVLKCGETVVMKNARVLSHNMRWHTPFDIAVNGIPETQDNIKLANASATVPMLMLTNVAGIYGCTEKGAESIQNLPDFCQ